MASGGAALLLCALFFLSTAHPACSCREILQVSCEGDTAEYYNYWQRCGNNRFRCDESSTMEIQFGGTETSFKVVRTENTLGGLELDIEDPILSSTFKDTGCDFRYSFPQPGPLFAPPPPPQTVPDSLHDDFQSYCRVSNYRLLFSEVIKRYQQGGHCTTYNLYRTSTELENSQDPATRETCLLGPDPPSFIWNLSLSNNLDSTFNIVSVGFSSRHPSCFRSETSGSTCGNKHEKKVRMLIIGFSTAAGVSILAGLLFYLWRRNKNMRTPTTSTLLSQTASSLEPSSVRDPEAASTNYPTHVFRYEELHEATNGFSPSNELDHGGHGAVYRGTLPDGRAVAIKRLYENSRKRCELFLNEIAILSCLRHPNLVALYGCTSRHSRELLLVYEFIPNGTIADHLHGRRAAEGAMTWHVRLRVAVEIATALAYLHAVEPQIIHRDVKTKNILLDGDFHVKVADFGLSRLFPVAASHVSTVPQGTAGYVDPEYHRCYQLTDKSDVYSFGVVLAELISSKPAVDVTRHRHEINLSNMALNKIQNSALQELVDPKLGFETDWEVRRSIELVADLVMRCLQGDRDMRPTMRDVLEVLRGIEDGLHQAKKGGVLDHTAGDDMGLLRNCAAASPDSVVGKWSITMTTPNASG